MKRCRFYFFIFTLVSFVIFCFALVHPVSAVELINNGGFETGDFTGWTVTNQAGGNGSWFVLAGQQLPLSGRSAPGPASGLYYAVTDQEFSGAHALSQMFTVPGGAASVILSFDMFGNNGADNAIVNPAGLDYTAVPNQHSRVDILTAAAGAFDTGADVLQNLFLGASGVPYHHYLFDITGVVGGGGPFIIRFAEVDNQFFFDLGVDNVSINLNPVPEPTTMLLLGSGLLGLVGLRRKFKN